MGFLAAIALLTFVAAMSLTIVARTAARHCGVVDRPDGRRKLHNRAVPLWGGVAVYAATVLGLLAVRFAPGGASTEFAELSGTWIIAAGFVCLVGSIDDCFDLPARLKLLLQIVSVLPIICFGYYVDRVVAFSHPIELGWLGIPLTVLWLVGCINALNLIDGMDGLASIVGLSATALLGVIAANEGHGHVAVMALVLAASLLGFLLYNLPPASVFLGDSGSMVIGLSLGLLGIQGSLKTSATLAITAPAVMMTLPMFDIVAAMVRRRLTGRRFDVPDRLHIHHRLLDRGWTPWQVLWLIGAVCLTTGAAATAATIFRLDALAWITAMSLVVLMIRLRLFGYEEFALAKSALRRIVLSCVAAVARFPQASGLRAPDHGAATLSAGTSRASRTRNLALWDLLIHDVRLRNIHQVEFCAPEDTHVRRVRWINPAMPAGAHCCWGVSVSLPRPDGGRCELRAASTMPISDQREFAVLTSLLETFGAHFAAHSEQILGPLPVVLEPLVDATYPRDQRKAA